MRLLVRRAAIGSMLTAEQLLEVADTLDLHRRTCIAIACGLTERYQRADRPADAGRGSRPGGQERSPAASTRAATCSTWPAANWPWSASKLADLDERVQSKIKRLLRDPELRKILRYPNATVSGDHYVLPVAVNHRHKIAGVVHRTSSTGETIFIEPAERRQPQCRADASSRARKSARSAGSCAGSAARSARCARPLSQAIEVMARLDFITAKARFSRDYGMSAPDINTEGQLWLRQARHPLLEHLFRHAAAASRSRTAPTQIPRTRFRRPQRRNPRQVVPIDVRLGHRASTC